MTPISRSAAEIADARDRLASFCDEFHLPQDVINLNGGAGAPSFLYVAERHQPRLEIPLWGWMEHASPFDFDISFRPADGTRRTLCGTPQVLGLTALATGVEVVIRAGMENIREKSVALSSLLIKLVDETRSGSTSSLRRRQRVT